MVKAVDVEAQKISTRPTREDRVRANPQTREEEAILAKRRAFDSEVKILEDVYGRTTPQSVGRLKLVTERDMCDSCAEAISWVRSERPGIVIEVFYQRTYP
jgi:hypothetical protein